MIKKLVLLSFILFSGIIESSAQHEVKLNALGLFYGNYGGAYEYGFADNYGVNISGSYFSTGKFLKKILNLGFVSKEVNSEFRFYFSKNNNSSGIFVGPYLKYIKREYSGIPFVETDDSVDVKVTDINVNKLAFGASTGYKAVVLNNLILGVYLGLGMNIYSNRIFTNTEITEEQKNGVPQGLTPVNFRIGVNVGYRFVYDDNGRYY